MYYTSLDGWWKKLISDQASFHQLSLQEEGKSRKLQMLLYQANL